jgi:hypothetical protein
LLGRLIQKFEGHWLQAMLVNKQARRKGRGRFTTNQRTSLTAKKPGAAAGSRSASVIAVATGKQVGDQHVIM